jgi:3-deoxy-D-manno-octulosonic-acid transferase
MVFIYNLIFILFAIMYFPYLLIRGKWHKDFPTRLGNLDESLIEILSQKKNIWIHAVSVGEFQAILPMIERIRRLYPNKQIVCSTVTTTAHSLAQSKLTKDDVLIYAPLDGSWITSKYVAAIDPQIYIAMETEIWPNLYRSLFLKQVPIVLVNGRISDRSFERYKLIQGLLKRVLNYVSCFCMQTEMDAQKIIRLGAPRNKTLVVGNIKFDMPLSSEVKKPKDFGFKDTDWILVGGSTHPGEEDILLEIYEKLVKVYPDLRLVLVPRHVERKEELVRMVKSHQRIPVCFSQRKEVLLTCEYILIVDVIGQLRYFYGLAKCVFIGKTLKIGGAQNMIEPVWFGAHTIVGPMVSNFKDVVDIFLKEQVLVQVTNQDDLLHKIEAVLKSSSAIDFVKQKGPAVVRKYQGATEKTLLFIQKVLAEK